jgi:hypothetical protein
MGLLALFPQRRVRGIVVANTAYLKLYNIVTTVRSSSAGVVTQATGAIVKHHVAEHIAIYAEVILANPALVSRAFACLLLLRFLLLHSSLDCVPVDHLLIGRPILCSIGVFRRWLGKG